MSKNRYTHEENCAIAHILSQQPLPQKNLPQNHPIWGRGGEIHKKVIQALPHRSACSSWEQLSTAIGNDTWKSQGHKQGYSRTYVRLMEVMEAEGVITKSDLKAIISG